MTAPYTCYRDMLYELKATAEQASMPDVFNGLRFMKQATDRINRKLRIRFQPFYENMVYDPITWQIDSDLHQMTPAETFFSLTQVKDGNGDVMDSSLYFIVPWQKSPYRTIQLSGSSGRCLSSWYQTVCSPYIGSSQAAVRAVWGWHPDYSNAWADTLDTVQDDPLTVGASIMNVNQASGPDIYGRFPRFSPGQLLGLGSGDTFEIVELTVVNGDALSLLRGQNGTTAVEHAQEETIKVWDAPWDVQQAAVRFACYPYKRRGDYAVNNFNMVSGVSVSLPLDLPGEVCGILQDYANGAD